MTCESAPGNCQVTPSIWTTEREYRSPQQVTVTPIDAPPLLPPVRVRLLRQLVQPVATGLLTLRSATRLSGRPICRSHR